MAKQTKRNKRSLFDSKRNVFIAALLAAVLSWVIVAGFIEPNQDSRIDNVAINYRTNRSNFSNLGLEIVGERRTSATVYIHGDGSEINGVDNTDITVYCDYSGITEPGTYTVPLRAASIYASNYDITDISPKEIELTFERVSSATLTVQVVSEGITAASGYYKASAISEPLTVSVSGPESEMAHVERAVVVVPDELEREANYTYSDANVQLMDAAGNVIESDLITIEPAQVSVEIPIYPEKELPITVDITGTPPNFDTAWFRSLLTFSQESIRVAGDAAQLAQIDSLEIGSVDVANFAVDDEYVSIQVTLPDGVRNRDNIQQIEISLDASTLAQKTFSIPLAQATVTNAPANMEVSPVGVNNTQETYEVTLVGPEEMINAILVENIVLEIDASSLNVEDGRQQSLPVRIYVPRYRRVYSLENLAILCNITES